MGIYTTLDMTVRATFGMSSFWWPEAQYGCAPGIVRTKVGYSGGTTPDPSYRSLGDHTEVIELEFDPGVTSFGKLLEFFWSHHDPHAAKACARQYRSVIFYHGMEQKMMAETSLRNRERLTKRKIPTQIQPVSQLFIAEDYHQKYLLQKQGWLLTELDLEPGEELVQSMVATRLNGYTNGYGSKDHFLSEKDGLKLSKKVVEYIMKKIDEERNRA